VVVAVADVVILPKSWYSFPSPSSQPSGSSPSPSLAPYPYPLPAYLLRRIGHYLKLQYGVNVRFRVVEVVWNSATCPIIVEIVYPRMGNVRRGIEWWVLQEPRDDPRKGVQKGLRPFSPTLEEGWWGSDDIAEK
jgi:hypothetical protein